jgi:predicted nucleic acid-binding Zn ribbon protein
MSPGVPSHLHCLVIFAVPETAQIQRDKCSWFLMSAEDESILRRIIIEYHGIYEE